jgi:hypothetical protein
VTLTVILTPASIHVNEAAVTRLNLRRDSGRGVSQQTETLGDGWFDISGMPGTYTVSPVSPSAVPLPSFNVTLPPLRAAELEAALPRLRSVTVRTTVEGGAAPPPFSLSIRGTIAAGRPERQARQGTVQALSPETPVSGVTVDIVPGRDGAARIFLPDGRYQFDAAPAAGSAARLRLKSIEGAGANLIHNALEVAGDEKEIKVLFE